MAHSVVLKLMTFGLPGTAVFFRSVGLPDWLAYLTFVSELVGGIMLVLGVHARVAAAALAPFLIGALVTVHAGNGWVLTSTGGGWEYPAYLTVLCVAQVLLGDGAFTLAGSRPLGAISAGTWPPPDQGGIDAARTYAVYPSRQHLAPKVRALEFEHLSPKLQSRS